MKERKMGERTRVTELELDAQAANEAYQAWREEQLELAQRTADVLGTPW